MNEGFVQFVEHPLIIIDPPPSIHPPPIGAAARKRSEKVACRSE